MGCFFYCMGGKHSSPSFLQQANVALPKSLKISPAQQPNLLGLVPSPQRPFSMLAAISAAISSSDFSGTDGVTGIGGKHASPLQQYITPFPISAYSSPGQQPFASGLSHGSATRGSCGAKATASVFCDGVWGAAIWVRVAAIVRDPRPDARATQSRRYAARKSVSNAASESF